MMNYEDINVLVCELISSKRKVSFDELVEYCSAYYNHEAVKYTSKMVKEELDRLVKKGDLTVTLISRHYSFNY